jgi:Ankyrin repeat
MASSSPQSELLLRRAVWRGESARAVRLMRGEPDESEEDALEAPEKPQEGPESPQIDDSAQPTTPPQTFPLEDTLVTRLDIPLLHLCAASPHCRSASSLIDTILAYTGCGVDDPDQTGRGWTALQVAAALGHAQQAEALLRAGANAGPYFTAATLPGSAKGASKSDGHGDGSGAKTESSAMDGAQRSCAWVAVRFPSAADLFDTETAVPPAVGKIPVEQPRGPAARDLAVFGEHHNVIHVIDEFAHHERAISRAREQSGHSHSPALVHRHSEPLRLPRAQGGREDDPR